MSSLIKRNNNSSIKLYFHVKTSPKSMLTIQILKKTAIDAMRGTDCEGLDEDTADFISVWVIVWTP